MRTFIALSIITAFTHFDIHPKVVSTIALLLWFIVCVLQDFRELQR